MPSKRTSAIIGIWVIFAVLMIVDVLIFQGVFLDSFIPGFNGLLNILILAWLPVLVASWLLDRRAQPAVTEEARRRVPRGARSASGEPIRQTRPQPRIRRGKRAAQLETIVVEPGTSGNSSVQVNSATSPLPSVQQSSTSNSRFLRSRRTQADDEKMEQQVQEQLDALEEEMAKLEEQLEQNGIPTSSSNSTPPPDTNQSDTNLETSSTNSSSNELSSEEATSELQAIDELLNRLEQRKRSGSVDEETYLRLRSKYIKRRSELS